MKNPEDAADIQQSTMLKAWNYLHTLKDPEKVKSWIFAIAHNEAMRLIDKRAKDEARQSAFLAEPESMESLQTERDDILDALVASENMELVKQGLMRLKVGERQLIAMRYLDELTPMEMGELLHKNPSTVRSSLCRALKRLRREVQRLDQEGRE